MSLLFPLPCSTPLGISVTPLLQVLLNLQIKDTLTPLVISVTPLLQVLLNLQIKDTLHMGESSFMIRQWGTWQYDTFTARTNLTTIRLGYPQ